MMGVKIDIVYVGWKRYIEGILVEAHSTVSLVTVDGWRMLVDTGSSNTRESVLFNLRALGVEPEDVDVVVNTHLHHDHASNNDLFVNATFYAHRSDRPLEGTVMVDEDMNLRPGIDIIHTPGHTPGCLSVLLETDRRYALVGDAIPGRDNFEKWAPPGINFDIEIAMVSMKRLVDWADVIVPGHDDPFPIDK